MDMCIKEKIIFNSEPTMYYYRQTFSTSKNRLKWKFTRVGNIIQIQQRDTGLFIKKLNKTESMCTIKKKKRILSVS